jgi:hypothetical protein
MEQDSATPPAAEGQTPPAAEGQAPAAPPPVEDTERQEPRTYDEKYVRELRREAATARTRANDAEAKLKERDDADKSEGEKLAERASTAETRAAEAEATLLRFEIAAERGLDLKAARFLAGTTKEEIEASADELGALIADTSKGKTPPLDGGARRQAEKRGTPEEEHRDLLLGALGRKT